MKISIENNIVKSVKLEGNERSVVIPDGVIGIASHAFMNCRHRIENLYIPASLQEIEDSEIGSLRRIEVATENTVFCNEDNCLINIEQRKIIIGNREGQIPKSAKIIGMHAYAECEAEEIVIPGNIEVIEGYSFSYSKCRKVSIEEGVRVIERSAFSRCSCLEGVIIPSSVESIDADVFEGVPGLEAFVVNANNRRYKSINGHLIADDVLICGCCNSIIPDCVSVIGDYSFFNRSNLKSLSIPSSVVEIGRWAFFGCSMLTDISIPDSVKSIGESAFFRCDSITAMPEINGVEVLENGVFGDCKNLRKIHIGKNINEIIPGAFEKCPQIDEITVSDENNYYKSVENCLLTKDGKALILGCCNSSIPEGVECIEKSAFSGSDVIGSKLEKVVMPSSLITIGDSAFSSSNSLKQVILNEGLRDIGSYAFAYSDSIENVVLPKGLKTIGFDAFRDCKKLESIEIQSTELKAISSGAFSGCSSLKSIVIPEGTESIVDFAFFFCKNLGNVVLPKSINYIGRNAFSGCTSLKQINVPHSAKIGEEAFDKGTVITIV